MFVRRFIYTKMCRIRHKFFGSKCCSMLLWYLYHFWEISTYVIIWNLCFHRQISLNWLSYVWLWNFSPFAVTFSGIKRFQGTLLWCTFIQEMYFDQGTLLWCTFIQEIYFWPGTVLWCTSIHEMLRFSQGRPRIKHDARFIKKSFQTFNYVKLEKSSYKKKLLKYLLRIYGLTSDDMDLYVSLVLKKVPRRDIRCWLQQAGTRWVRLYSLT